MIAISINESRIAQFCRRWGVDELALFGSVLRDDFRPDSDIDVSVSFASGVKRSLFDLVRMAEELESIFQHPVDLYTRRGVERARSAELRREILNSAEVIHAA